jgi:hypothetical protein
MRANPRILIHMDLNGGRKSSSARPVASWEVVEKEQPYLNSQKNLRLRVTYADGKCRVLPAAFKDRAALDKYVTRFHPEYAGKEQPATAAPVKDPV